MPLPVSTQKHSRVQSNVHFLGVVSVGRSTAAFKRWNPRGLVHHQKVLDLGSSTLSLCNSFNSSFDFDLRFNF